MARSKDKNPLPWSIKGISPEAREAAKAAAASHGMTMGEWMSRAIRRAGGADEAEEPVAHEGTSPLAALDTTALEAEIAKRIRGTEERLLGVVEPLYDIVEELRRRLDRLEARDAEPNTAPATPITRAKEADSTDSDEEQGR